VRGNCTPKEKTAHIKKSPSLLSWSLMCHR